ncbi:MAG: TPM domain-containing protein [Prevotellaceae bacterium]|jgi:uncharacterized protein|nr:TPM domain-containing protein [Prevotellaceae bacterium]
MKKLLKISLLGLLIGSSSILSAQIPEKPSPARLVNDFAGIFTPNQVQELEQFLVMADDSTSNQLCVVTIGNLNGMDISQFATELGQKWGVGGEKNNGIVILIKPKTERERGEAFIAVSYGLEGVIPDIIANRVVDELMIPQFRKNDYYGGTVAAVDYLYRLAKGEINAPKEKSQHSRNVIFIAIFIVILILILVSKSKNGNKPNDNHEHTSYGSSALPWILAGSSFGRSSGSYGGGSFGGSFGGFGGGGFGGGGAGGSW